MLLKNIIYKNDPELVSELLKDPKTNVNETDSLGYSPLMNSCLKHENIAKILLSHPKVDVNIQSYSGYTALMDMCLRNNEVMIRALLNHPDIVSISCFRCLIKYGMNNIC